MEIEKPDWLTQMEGILETLNEGVLVQDDCQRFIFANERFLQMAGATREAIIGRGLQDFFQGQDLDFMKQQVAQSWQRGHSRYEFFVPRADGARVPVVISGRVLEDLDGREFAVVTLTDISHQKSIEQQLREANDQLAARQREIEFELSLAERVQQSLVPQSLRWGRAVVETAYQPVHSIGGDFGMIVPQGEEALTMTVCDVSGHGISSALIANRIHSESVSLLERGADLGDLLRGLNRFVLQHIRTTGFYFSMAAARLHRDGRLSYAGAGHPPAICARVSGQCREFMPRSAVLGLLEDAVPDDPVEEINFGAGDRLLLYTDGVTETFNDRDEQFGAKRLSEILKTHCSMPLPDLKQTILERVAAWRHGPIADDMSLVLVEVT